MQKTSNHLFILVLFLSSIVVSCESNSSSETTNGEEHFSFILYDGLTDSITVDITATLMNNYDRITSTLQVDSMPHVTIEIWRNYNNYLNAQQANIGRAYNGSTGYIKSPTELCVYLNAGTPGTATHEFAHLVSMQVNHTIPNNPRWLWETTALFLNQEFVDPRTISSIANRNYPTLSQLNNDFNTNDNLIYRVGYVLGKYIVDTWGTEGLIHLIENNGQIQQTLNIPESEFENGWEDYLQEKYF